MLKLIRTSALVFGSLCLLASLGLCFRIPEGALFLFVVGCSWLGLSLLATPKGTEATPSDGLGRAI